MQQQCAQHISKQRGLHLDGLGKSGPQGLRLGVVGRCSLHMAARTLQAGTQVPRHQAKPYSGVIC